MVVLCLFLSAQAESVAYAQHHIAHKGLCGRIVAGVSSDEVALRGALSEDVHGFQLHGEGFVLQETL